MAADFCIQLKRGNVYFFIQNMEICSQNYAPNDFLICNSLYYNELRNFLLIRLTWHGNCYNYIRYRFRGFRRL
jgi:hypothetical protein